MRSFQRAALNAAKRLVANRPNVTGVDFGHLYRRGKKRRGYGIRFHVSSKLPASELSIPALLPTSLGDCPCDVVEARYEPHASTTQINDPIRPGISIGNVDRSATGTLGAFVKDSRSAETCLLSNWHVICGSKLAKQTDIISQPGPAHLWGQPARPVARPKRWTNLAHGLDAAIAALSEPAGIEWAAVGLPVLAGTKKPRVGMKVIKSAAISGVTHAIIEGIEGSYKIDYSAFGDSERWMDGMRLVVDPEHPESEISLEGDSGSIWMETGSKAAVALHFAGEDGLGPLAEYSLAHDFGDVCKRLEIEVIT